MVPCQSKNLIKPEIHKAIDKAIFRLFVAQLTRLFTRLPLHFSY
jgi:hypothetical protein